MALQLGAWAQKASSGKRRLGYGDRHFYSAMVNNLRAGLALTIDSSTKWIEYSNTIANQPANNYVFLEGAQNIGLYLATPQDSASYYRYSIFDSSGKAVVLDQKPITATANYYNQVAKFNLGKFNVDRNSLTIKFYNIDYRNNAASVVIYNKPIKPAQVKITTLYMSDKKGQSGMQMKFQPTVLNSNCTTVP